MLARSGAPRLHRVDHLLIADMVTPCARVLDVGCGDGALLQLLAEKKQVDGRGMEVSRERVNACVAQGLSVVQGDADVDLAAYPDGAFDYAILSLTIQATLRPKVVVEHLLRIGRRAIVSFPNFGHWRIRLYESPDSHLCTIVDFVELCDKLGAEVERSAAFNDWGQQLSDRSPVGMQNLFGEKAVFLLRKTH